MQVIGLCRFSYLGLGGFKVEHETLDARRAFLYDPARLEERFRLFEAVTLPSIVGQTDADFDLVLAIGQDFPDPWLKRLQDLVAGVPQIRLRGFPPGRHRTVMSRALLDARRPSDLPCLQFRLDDDDAMGLSFVERFRAVAQDLRPFWARHDRMAVDFNTGHVYRADATGIAVHPFKYPYSAIALGMIVQPGCDDTIMNHGHHRLWEVMPTLTFPGDNMMLRGHNDFNDSRLKGGGKRFAYAPLTSVQESEFRVAFGLDNDRVRAVFSRPGPKPAFPEQGE